MWGVAKYLLLVTLKRGVQPNPSNPLGYGYAIYLNTTNKYRTTYLNFLSSDKSVVSNLSHSDYFYYQ